MPSSPSGRYARGAWLKGNYCCAVKGNQPTLLPDLTAIGMRNLPHHHRQSRPTSTVVEWNRGGCGPLTGW